MSPQSRQSIRLPHHDYADDGVYFVTVCTHQRQCLFGQIIDGEMILNSLGRIVHDEWQRTAVVRPYVTLDAFVVMPNHVHGIIVLSGGGVGARRAVPLQTPLRSFGHSIPGSLATVVGAFKSAATKRINDLRAAPGEPVWQRNYYEHIIRTEDAWNAIRQYIQTNPAQWAQDTENPANRGQSS